MAFADIAGALIQAGSSLIGSVLASDSVESGNEALIATLERGQDQAIAELRGGETAAFGFLDTGREATLRALAPLLISGAAGETILRREAVADPSIMSPAQQRALEDAQRVTQSQLATSGLRGAGRTQSAILKDVTDQFIANAQEDNRSRSLSAADRLFGAGAAARGAAANTEFGTGTAKAGAATGTGINAANVIQATAGPVGASQQQTGKIVGGLQGGAAISLGSLAADTLGTIAGQIADENKRESAFKNFKPIE